MAFCGYLLLTCIFFLSTLSILSVYRNRGSHYLLEIFTLFSAILFTFAVFVRILLYYQLTNTLLQLEKKIVYVSGAWSLIALLNFFYYISDFPWSAPYSGYSAFYLLIFHIPLLAFTITVIVVFATFEKFYSFALGKQQFYFLGYVGLAYLTGGSTQSFYYFNDYLVGLGTIVINFGTAFVLRSIMKDKLIDKGSRVIMLLLFELLAGISCPLMPFYLILNFILQFAKENPFTINYLFASISLVNVYIIGLTGLTQPIFHFLYDIAKFLDFSENLMTQRARIIDSIFFAQQVAQFVVLGCFFYFYTEPNLPYSGYIGPSLFFLICGFQLYHHIYMVRKVCIFPQNITQFNDTLMIHVGTRILLYLVQLIISLICFMIAYFSEQFFIEYRYYTIFTILCTFHCLYSGFLTAQYGTMVNVKTKEYFRLLEEQRRQIGIVHIHKKEEVELKHEECAVCLNDLFNEDGTGDVIQIKNCGHLFHKECIMNWFEKDLTCPTDRKRV